MSEFEYLAVFISIIFGIGLTRLLTGLFRSIYSGIYDHTRIVLTVYMFYAMLLNWWTAFSWQSEQVWSFDLFLIIILWSVAHYLAAVALYPPRVTVTDGQSEYRINWVLWALISIVFADILQTGMRGDVFSPWYYLPYALHYVVLYLIAIFLKKEKLYRWLVWYFLASVVVWSLVVRRFMT
jgi:hypothetical protein